MRLTFFLRFASVWLIAATVRQAGAQMVEPVITEYKVKASGKLMLTNNSKEPMAVTLEPRSFSIAASGHGTFRDLDPAIHVELSAMSVKLQPQETYYVFYKASSEMLPAWFTIYATFSPIHHGQDVAVRIQLPHTVYLYQKGSLLETDLSVTRAIYSPTTHKLVCDVTNAGISLGRAHGASASGPHGGSATLAGFPLLPGMTRRLELNWTDKDPPTSFQIAFDHFTLRPSIEQEALRPASTSAAVDVAKSQVGAAGPPAAGLATDSLEQAGAGPGAR